MTDANLKILWKISWGCCLGSSVGIIVLFWLVANQPDVWARAGINSNWALGVLVFLFLGSLIAAVIVKNVEQTAGKSRPR